MAYPGAQKPVQVVQPQVQYVQQPIQGQPIQVQQPVQYIQGSQQPIQYVQGQQPPQQQLQQPVQYVQQPVQYVQQPVQYVQQPVVLQQAVNAQGQVVYIQQQPMATTAPVSQSLLDVTLTTELSNTAQNQLNFFRSINQWYSELLTNATYTQKQENSKLYWENVIIDYEQYMDKIASNPSMQIPMSIEMELIWRIHLLNPQCYINDCMKKYGQIIAHNSSTVNMQYIRHNSNNFRNTVLKNSNVGNTGFIGCGGQQLIMTDAIKRQCKFIRKIIKINMFDPITVTKITASIARYDQFLQTIWAPNKPQNLIAVPTLDVDLIWHSHQLNPQGYYNFCTVRSPYKKLITHDDNLADEVLTSNGNATQQFWDTRYGAGNYLNARAFSEPTGNEKYDKMKIYNKWPQWKIVIIVVAILTVIACGVFIGVSETGAAIFTGIVGLVVMCVLNQQKCGDVAAQRRQKRNKGRGRNTSCGASNCGAVYYGDGYDGGGGGGDGGDGGDGGGCGGGGCGGGGG